MVTEHTSANRLVQTHVIEDAVERLGLWGLPDAFVQEFADQQNNQIPTVHGRLGQASRQLTAEMYALRWKRVC